MSTVFNHCLIIRHGDIDGPHIRVIVKELIIGVQTLGISGRDTDHFHAEGVTTSLYQIHHLSVSGTLDIVLVSAVKEEDNVVNTPSQVIPLLISH